MTTNDTLFLSGSSLFNINHIRVRSETKHLLAFKNIIFYNETVMTKARVHYNHGNALRAEGKDEQAIKEYQKALRIDPTNNSAKSGLKHIADRYAILTSAAVSRYDHARAAMYLTRGLKVDRSHKRLRSLKTKVRAINTPSKRFIKQVKEQPKWMVNKIENLLD